MPAGDGRGDQVGSTREIAGLPKGRGRRPQLREPPLPLAAGVACGGDAEIVAERLPQVGGIEDGGGQSLTRGRGGLRPPAPGYAQRNE